MIIRLLFTCCARPEAELLGHLPPVVDVLGLDLHLVVRLHLQLDNINQWELSIEVSQWQLTWLRTKLALFLKLSCCTVSWPGMTTLVQA